MKVVVIIGTRPEAIKLAPVVMALKGDSRFETVVCSTGQHREMLQQVLDLFQLEADVNLDLMRPNQTLAALHARAMKSLDEFYSEETPELVLVQGDTSTAMVGAMAAFYRDIFVGHVEAGLRTDDNRHPFPEEMNRRVISQVAQYHFPPTERSYQTLVDEGHSKENIVLSGNTVIDALLWVQQHLSAESRKPFVVPKKRLILVTAHRRESFGKPLKDICRALLEITRRYSDVHLLFPVHPNPNVRKTVNDLLSGNDHISLIDPLPYDRLVAAMDQSEIILTDSGGIQEEAPSLGKPVLVLREKTERPEAVEAGTSILVGRDKETILEETEKLLSDKAYYDTVATRRNPFGDGQAARRIIEFLARL